MCFCSKGNCFLAVVLYSHLQRRIGTCWYPLKIRKAWSTAETDCSCPHYSSVIKHLPEPMSSSVHRLAAKNHCPNPVSYRLRSRSWPPATCLYCLLTESSISSKDQFIRCCAWIWACTSTWFCLANWLLAPYSWFGSGLFRPSCFCIGEFPKNGTYHLMTPC